MALVTPSLPGSADRPDRCDESMMITVRAYRRTVGSTEALSHAGHLPASPSAIRFRPAGQL
jgi:hypothetical protein